MWTVYSPHHRLHDTTGLMIEGQPYRTEELPERADLLAQAVQEARLGPIELPQDHGLAPVQAVHTQDFLDFLQTIYAEAAAFTGQAAPLLPGTFAIRPVRHKSNNFAGKLGVYCFGVDSPILAGTWKAAYWSAQCALTAADRIQAGDPAAYAICRPPGHHAAADLYGGFCYLNNAAIAARYLGSHTAILDIDYHHGNGTQEIFYEDPNVLYCSIHAHPDQEYPYYWGEETELGSGPGKGYNRNWPLPRGTCDSDYLTALEAALAAIEVYQPRVLIVSAGFDIGAGDPVGGFEISTDGLAEIGHRIASQKAPVLIIQEGGYQLDRLGERAVAFLKNFV